MTHILSNCRSSLKNLADSIIHREVAKITLIPNRTKYYKKHLNDNFRKERGRKVWKIELPDFDFERKKMNSKMDPEQIRSEMKKKGIAPQRPWNERELYYPSSLMVIDPYKPEGDGQSSLLGKVKGTLMTGKDAITNRKALSTIRNYEGDDFNLQIFAQQAIDIYVKAHEALMAKDDKGIFQYVTERCFTQMSAGLDYCTIHWKFHGLVNDPEVVQVRVGEMLTKTNKMSQITVKFHTKQTLALYDRHGRLSNGSPNEVREVLEYLVFEKLLTDEYGSWRLHDRIRPEQQSSYNRIQRTFVVEENNEQSVELDKPKVEVEKSAQQTG